MVSITIRRLEDGVKAKLRVRAAHHGRSMEEEASDILKHVLIAEELPRVDLAQAIRRHIEPCESSDAEHERFRKLRVGHRQSLEGLLRRKGAARPWPDERGDLLT